MQRKSKQRQGFDSPKVSKLSEESTVADVNTPNPANSFSSCRHDFLETNDSMCDRNPQMVKDSHSTKKSHANMENVQSEATLVKAKKANLNINKAQDDQIRRKQKTKVNVKKYSLFIGKLPFDATKEEVEAHFRKYVDFISVRIPISKTTNASRGYAFIDLATEEDYKAVLGLNKSVLKGKQISVEYTCAGSKKSKKRSSKIKAKNLKFKGLREKGIMPQECTNKKSKNRRRHKIICTNTT